MARILVVLVLLVAVMSLEGEVVRAAHCDVTVVANASIQDAVDAAGDGEVVCLDGDFTGQRVIFRVEADSFTTLAAAHGADPVLDGGTLVGSFSGITILEDVHDVTINGLTIESFTKDGIRVNGNDNNVHHNNVNDNGINGIRVNGDDNNAHHNIITGNVLGIELNGDENNVHHNTVCSNDADAIRISGGGADNVVKNNTADPIVDSGTGNVLKNNVDCPSR